MIKSRLFINVALHMSIVGWAVYTFYAILKSMSISKSRFFFLFILAIYAIYELFALIISTMSENFQLTLEEKYFSYKSYFIDIKEEYKEIKDMKIISKPLGRLMGDEHILRIRLRRKRNIYIALYSISKKQSRTFRELLMKKTGKVIIKKKKKVNK